MLDDIIQTQKLIVDLASTYEKKKLEYHQVINIFCFLVFSI